MSGKEKVVWELRPTILANLKAHGTITLGSYGPEGPPVVVLSRKRTTVEGEEYAKYSNYLQRAVPPTPVSAQASNLRKLKALQERKVKEVAEAAEPAEPKEVVAADVAPEAVEAVEVVEEVEHPLSPTPPSVVNDEPEPEPEEADILPLEREPVWPTADEIRTLNREELEEKAKYLGVWEDIEGTGRDGYCKSSDISNYLLDLIQGD